MISTEPTKKSSEKASKRAIMLQAKERFKIFLEQNKNRKTPERFAILEEIYMNQQHFDAEALYIKMKQNAYRVSRATIYNTLDILVSCQLVIQHQFGHNKTLYEKAYGLPPHDHIICVKCGEIKEFFDERVNHIISKHTSEEGFLVARHSMNIYGVCRTCRNSH